MPLAVREGALTRLHIESIRIAGGGYTRGASVYGFLPLFPRAEAYQGWPVSVVAPRIPLAESREDHPDFLEHQTQRRRAIATFPAMSGVHAIALEKLMGQSSIQEVSDPGLRPVIAPDASY